MASDEQETRAAFAKVFAEFAEDLEKWVKTMEQAAGIVSSSSDQTEIEQAINTLREWAHKVCGSAGSFGYMATSESAAPMENLCVVLIEEKRLPLKEETQTITDMIKAIRTAMADELPKS